MKKSLRFASIGLSIMMAVAFMPSAAFASGSTIENSLNTDIYDYVGSPKDSGELAKAKEAENYPSAYDLSDGRIITDADDPQNIITPVKFQNPYGTCWGFAAIAAAEGSIINEAVNEHGADKDDLRDHLDLSEKHLAWFSNGKIEDENDSQYGEGVVWDKGVGNSERFNTGGTPKLATGLFASGVGPVREDRIVDEQNVDLFKYFGVNKEVQYKKLYNEEAGKYVTTKLCYSDEDDWTIPYDYRFYQSYKLEQSFVLPSPANYADGTYSYNEAGTNAIKDQLIQGRPVAIGFKADTASPNSNQDGTYINLDTWSHYTYEEGTGANHAVTVVGYDDNYSASNFIDGFQPPADGAFLVKNSWGAGENEFPNKGSGWGIEVDGQSTGYFWLSYYDKSISMCEAYDFDLDNEGDTEYYLDQYDYAPEESPTVETSEDLIKSSNVFTADCTEKIFSVGCQTSAPNTDVTYEIYILGNDFDNPEDGYLAASKSEVYEYGGYHKASIDDEVIVQKGQHYSIVVTQLQSDGNYAIFNNTVYTKAMYAMYGIESNHEGNAIVNKGESFSYKDEEWTDFAGDSEVKKDNEDNVLDVDNFPIKGYGMKCSDVQMRSTTSTVTLTELGEEDTISISLKGNADALTSDDVTWSSSNENIVSLSPYTDKKGHVTDFSINVKAEDYGTAYVYASNPEMGSIIVKVNVQPPKPRLLEGSITKKGALKLTWHNDQVAEGYTIVYGPVGGKTKTVSIKASSLSEGQDPVYTVSKPTKNTIYSYEVYGYCFDADGNPVFGDSAYYKIAQKPKKTAIKKIKASGDGTITLTLKKFNCTGYDLQCSTSKKMKDPVETSVKGGENTYVEIDGLTPGKKYYVRVHAYNEGTDDVAYSAWTAKKTVKVK